MRGVAVVAGVVVVGGGLIPTAGVVAAAAAAAAGVEDDMTGSMRRPAGRMAGMHAGPCGCVNAFLIR